MVQSRPCPRREDSRAERSTTPGAQRRACRGTRLRRRTSAWWTAWSRAAEDRAPCARCSSPCSSGSGPAARPPAPPHPPSRPRPRWLAVRNPNPIVRYLNRAELQAEDDEQTANVRRALVESVPPAPRRAAGATVRRLPGRGQPVGPALAAATALRARSPDGAARRRGLLDLRGSRAGTRRGPRLGGADRRTGEPVGRARDHILPLSRFAAR